MNYLWKPLHKCSFKEQVVIWVSLRNTIIGTRGLLGKTHWKNFQCEQILYTYNGNLTWHRKNILIWARPIKNRVGCPCTSWRWMNVLIKVRCLRCLQRKLKTFRHAVKLLLASVFHANVSKKSVKKILMWLIYIRTSSRVVLSSLFISMHFNTILSGIHLIEC